MANTQNNNSITMSSNELVRYNNKYKVISKYDDKKYESNEVELINPALANLEVKILDPVKDEDEITLTAEVENGDSNQTYNYKWFIYKEDGETELPYGLGSDTSIAHIEDLDELEQFCLVSVAAYTTQGLFVGVSDIKTIYKDTEDITSPVIIDLSNDSTTIPAELISSATTDDAKLFQELTVTYLTVLRGDEDITDDCDINWEASSDNVEFTVSENKRTVYITAMPATLKAASLIATVEYPKALTENQTGILTAQYNIIRAGEGATLYQLSLPQKVINTTYFTNNEIYTYSYRVKKCSGRQVTWLTQDQLDEEGLEVVWGYKEAQDVDLEDYTWESTADGTFEYEIGTHTGLHIVLRSKNDNDLARYYDSEIVPFVKDGAEFTDLVLSANSPSFNVDANGNFAQDTVVLTASLYGLLEKQENLIEWTWSLGDIPSGKVSSDRKTFTIAKADMGTNNAIEVGAAIKINGEDYYDKMTIYKLKEGSSALTAFLTNQCINFSANADGVVNADNNNTHTSKIKVFRGSEDVSHLVNRVEIPSIIPEGMQITTELLTEDDKQLYQIKVGIATGVAVYLGGVGSCDGELEFNITLTGSEAKIPLTLSWSKNNAGKDGAPGLNGTSPYTIQLDNDSDIVVKSSNGDWFVDDTEQAIIVNATCYDGNQADTSITASDCLCDPPSANWTGEHYQWNGSRLRITKIPDTNDYTFTSGYFTFRWIKNGATLATKNFSLSTTVAHADYDLIIPQVVYNIDTVGDNETFAISVLKKGKDKIETLTSPGSEKIKIFGPGGTEVGDWGRVPVPRTAGEYVYTLKSTLDSNLTWDEEVLTTVSNGEQGPVGPQGPQGGQGPQGTSPYLIELTNDSATIGTDKDGKSIDIDALRAATETTVQVWLGSDDITDECTFEWTPTGCTLSATTGDTVYLTTIDDDVDTASATVTATVTDSNTSIGSKTLTVTKNKQGETGASAVTYVLSVSPNSWNKTEVPEIVPSFTVTKYDGGTASNITTGYTIKIGNNTYAGTSITDTTTFDLWVGTVKVDSETVTAVANGNDSTVEGPAGPGIESEVRVYKWSSTTPETGGAGWATIDGIEKYDDSKKDLFLWTCYRQQWTNKEKEDYVYTAPIRMTDYEMGTLMASKEENMSISQWCEKYGRTLIDGSTVATGGLIAETIQSGNYALGTLAALDFTLVEDHYKVGLKSTDILSEVIIPERYNDKPVTELDIESFAAGKDIIQKLAIPAGITTNPFGLLTNYSKLVELHLPVHQIGYNNGPPYFGNWFGMEDYDGPGKTPDSLENVYLLGRSDNNIIPYTYFDMDTGGTNANIYLTPTITALAASALADADVGTVYYYNDDQFTDTDIANARGPLVKTDKTYKSPGIAATGFRITSKEDHPMIDSPNFRVTQDGIVYAKNGEFTGTIHAQAGGDMAGWKINEDGISKNTTILYAGEEITLNKLFNRNDLSNSPIRFLAGLDEFDLPQRVDEVLLDSLPYYIAQGTTVNFSIVEEKMDYFDIDIQSLRIDKITYSSYSPTGGWDPIKNQVAENIQIIGVSYRNQAMTLTGSFEYSGMGSVVENIKVYVSFQPRVDLSDKQFSIICEDGYIYANNINVNGRVVATEGNIGSISLASVYPEGSDSEYAKNTGLFERAGGQTSGFYAEDSPDHMVFWAGCPENFTPWEYQNSEYNKAKDVTNAVKFFVTNNGKLVCQDINIKGGTLGGVDFSIDDNNNAQIIAKQKNFVIGGQGASLSFEEKSLADDFIRLVYQITPNSGSVDAFTFQLKSYDGNTLNAYKAPYTVKDEDLYGIWYNKKGEEMARGYLGIKTGIDEGKTEGNSPMIDLSKTIWFVSAKTVKIYNDSSCDPNNMVEIDIADENTSYTLLYKKEPKNSSRYQIVSSGNLYPGKDELSLGINSNPWKHIWCNELHQDIQWSDARLKNSIEPLPIEYEVFFDKIQPTRYKYNEGTSNRYHTGFIAQPLVEALEESGLNTQDFAGACLNKDENGEDYWYLRRDEFVALNTWQIQKLKARVKQAEETIELQDTYIKKLEERIEKLEKRLEENSDELL